MKRTSPTLLVAAVLSLLAVAPAGASQVQPVSITACAGEGGCQTTDTVRVDQAFGLGVSFKVTNAISSGNTIFIEGPVGTQFASNPGTQINWGLAGYSAFPTVANGGRRLQIPIPEWLEGPITSSGTVGINIGFFQNKITVPPIPGNFTVDVWTSADNTPRTSSAITTTIGKPSSLTAVVPQLEAVAGEPFALAPQAKLADSRGNPIAGEEVSFTLPDAGPGGSFEGGAKAAAALTDASGLVSPDSTVTAAGEAGEWQIALTGPESTSGAIDVTTNPAAPDEIDLEIDPAAVPADGTATAEATIKVFDEFGNAVRDEEVGLETDGGPSASIPALQDDGSFLSELTASTVPGEFTITAGVTGTTPTLSTTASFVQEELPASEIVFSLQPTSILADGASTSVAIATVRDRIGVGVAGEDVTFVSDGGNEIGPTIDLGDGTYTATVRSTTTPGEVNLTAAVTGAPGLSARSRLTQIPVPPPAKPEPPASGPLETKFVWGAKGVTRMRKVRFAFVSPSAAGFRCRLDKAAWKRCGSPAVFKVKPGRHVFRVRAMAADGTLGPVVKRVFKRLPPRR